MQLFNLLSLICAACAGATMGSYLLLTLVNKPLLGKHLKPLELTQVYARFYRLNAALSLMGGLLAALVNNQQAALLFAILAVSYVFNNMHLLKNILGQLSASRDGQSQRALDGLYLLQNLMHFLQFVGAAWAISLLN